MKKYLSRLIPVFIVVWIFAYNPVVSVSVENPEEENTADQKDEAAAVKTGYLENVLFQKIPGKERVNLVVSLQPVINVSTQADGSLLIKLENMSVPDNLSVSLGEGSLDNIVSVKPLQQLIDGKQFVYLTINVKESVPYAIRQEGKNIFIDFNVSSLAVKKTPATLGAKGKNQKLVAKKKDAANEIEEPEVISEGNEDEDVAKPVKKAIPRLNTQRLINLDFQDADIKTVLRLMAEYGNTSIISGEDVKGKVTLTIKNTPWEQALDSILDTQGLAKKQMGDVISVMTLDRKRKEESDRKEAEKDQYDAEEVRLARETKLLSQKGKLRQILIEAKLVEATETFIRNIGVNWGFGRNQSIGSYGLGTTGGTNTKTTRTWNQPYPPELALALPASMAAVNFPASIASPALGLVFGNASSFLEAQLAALETNSTGKVISAPKVVTMDGKKAIIKQGQEIPYITRTVNAQGGETVTVTFKEAVLKLEVTPRITEQGKISMEILAGNEVADWKNTVEGNPPINKNSVDSTVVIDDGDTVVIGGVLRDQEDKTVDGVPWFQSIPVLGWVFKSVNIQNEKRQLLVFITPKVISDGVLKDSAGKISN